MRWKAPIWKIRRVNRHGERGQALLEFALAVPLFLMLILAAIEFGLLINGHMVLANAVREGARAASLGQSVSQVNSRVISMSQRLNVTGNAITTAFSTDNGTTWTTMTIPVGAVGGNASSTKNPAPTGSLVRVVATVSYRQITNFIPGLNGLPITKTVIMRREPT